MTIFRKIILVILAAIGGILVFAPHNIHELLGFHAPHYVHIISGIAVLALAGFLQLRWEKSDSKAKSSEGPRKA